MTKSFFARCTTLKLDGSLKVDRSKVLQFMSDNAFLHSLIYFCHGTTGQVVLQPKMIQVLPEITRENSNT